MRRLSRCALAGLLCTSVAQAAPSPPAQLRAPVIGADEVFLDWDRIDGENRADSYLVMRNGEQVGRALASNFTATGLAPSTTYTFLVIASENGEFSAPATVIVTTADADWQDAATVTFTSGDGIRGGLDKREAALAALGLPGTIANATDTTAPAAKELATDGTQTAAIDSYAPEGYTLRFDSSFDGTGDVDVGNPDSLWRFDDMHDSLHRAGNGGMDEFGNTDVPDWRTATGKRWSAWYDDYQTDNAYRSDGLLVMQGLSSGVPDPTRQDVYMDEGVEIDYGSSKLYTAWLDTWSRTFDKSKGHHVMDPASPGKVFRYGYFEARVSFAEMITPGFRLSWWLMPASTDEAGQDVVAHKAYDESGDNGVEIDIFEYEFVDGQNPQLIQLTLLGGAAGDSGMTFDASTLGVDLRKGFHTIGFLWEPDRLVWTIDGKVARTITDAALIPDVYSYMVLTREMNSGVRRSSSSSIKGGDPVEQKPYRPGDPGLYLQNVWIYRDRLAADRALIDYVRVWQRTD